MLPLETQPEFANSQTDQAPFWLGGLTIAEIGFVKEAHARAVLASNNSLSAYQAQVCKVEHFGREPVNCV